MTERPDEDLVAAAQSGDYAAFEDLVRRHSGKVYRLCWSFVKNDHSAEDAMQETFLNAFRALERFKGDAKFGSWLYRIAVNTSLMRLRRRRRKPEVSLEDTKPEGSGSHVESPVLVESHRTPEREAYQRQLRERIFEAVDQLDEKYRVVFLLRDIDGLSIAETGEVLQLSDAAVKSRLHRARLHLRATLERYVIDD